MRTFANTASIIGCSVCVIAAPARALTLTPAAPTVAEGQRVTIKSDTPVTWSLSGVGSISTNADGSVTYAAPATIVPQHAMAGCMVFPNDSIFNTPIDSLPVNAKSATWVANLGTNSIGFEGAWGISLADNSTPMPDVKTYYGVTDLGPFVLPAIPALKRENGALRANSGSDHHVMSVRTTDCSFWEIYNNYFSPRNCQDGSPGCTATSAITYPWSNYRNKGGTDAAGLPLAALTLHLDEIEAGAVHHPMRMTSCTGCIYNGTVLWPAAAPNGSTNASAPPNGTRLRLKASFDISKFNATAQVVLTALKKYGIIIADNGSEEDITVGTDVFEDRQVGAALGQIAAAHITIGNFEAVDESSLMIHPNSYEVNPQNPYVHPLDSAVLTATPNAGGTAVSVPIALQGVTIGMPSPTMYIMAAMAYQLKWWVNGTSNQSVIWSVVSGTGSVTSSGLYTAPSMQAEGTTSSALLKGVSAADASAVVYLKVIVLPNAGNPPNSIRIDSGNNGAAAKDAHGNLWLPDQGYETGDWVELGGDYPAWADKTNPLINIFQSEAYNFGADTTYSFVVPNGVYSIHLLFGIEYDGCFPACTTYNPQLHAPLNIEVNGRTLLQNFDFGAPYNYAMATPSDVTVTATVTDNLLSIALRGVMPDAAATPQNANWKAPSLNGLEIVPGNVSLNTTTASTLLQRGELSLVRVHPNPWRVDKSKQPITFDHLGTTATIKIFTVSGHLVATLNPSTDTASWDPSGAASGLYLYLITDGQGNKTTGKFAIIH